jgi:hypothetical protein
MTENTPPPPTSQAAQVSSAPMAMNTEAITAPLRGDGPAVTQMPKKNIFADLSALKLSYGEGVLAGAKETLSRLPVRKANRQEFWRAHPSMSLLTAVYEDKDTREIYLIAPDMVGQMQALGEMTPVKLVPAITRQSVLLLIPAKLPGEASSNTAWQDTMLQATEVAKTKWLRTCADMSLGAYRIWEAEGTLSEPSWPQMTLTEMLEVAFKNRVIDSEDHPVFSKLLGRI